MTLQEIFDIETESILSNFDQIITESKKKRDKQRAAKFKPGRERIIGTVKKRLQQRGVSMSTAKIRDFAFEQYKLWKNKDKKVSWILRLERNANALGFDPRWCDAQKPGTPIPKEKQEQAGRSYFFFGLVQGYVDRLAAKKKAKQ